MVRGQRDNRTDLEDFDEDEYVWFGEIDLVSCRNTLRQLVNHLLLREGVVVAYTKLDFVLEEDQSLLQEDSLLKAPTEKVLPSSASRNGCRRRVHIASIS